MNDTCRVVSTGVVAVTLGTAAKVCHE